jgi:hypothetical protein
MLVFWGEVLVSGRKYTNKSCGCQRLATNAHGQKSLILLAIFEFRRTVADARGHVLVGPAGLEPATR